MNKSNIKDSLSIFIKISRISNPSNDKYLLIESKPLANLNLTAIIASLILVAPYKRLN